MKALIVLEITRVQYIVSAQDTSASNETPKCLSFLTSNKYGCPSISEFRNNREMPFRRPADEIEWKNVVIFMIIGNNEQNDRLIKAHFDTWLNHVGDGLEFWFVTDSDDERSLEDIIPEKRNNKIKYRLHRSNSENDGKHIRFKVIDSFRHLNKVYLKDRSKTFFYKMDTDTYLLPENLLSYTNKLNNEAQGLPVHVGRLMCVHKNVCHASGAL